MASVDSAINYLQYIMPHIGQISTDSFSTNNGRPEAIKATLGHSNVAAPLPPTPQSKLYFVSTKTFRTKRHCVSPEPAEQDATNSIFPAEDRRPLVFTPINAFHVS
jgi:hypothetical protein